MTIDITDRLILQALQRNSSQRLEDLAKLVRLASSSVHDRIRRLQRDGAIRRWTVDVDETMLGLNVLAFVGLRATKPCSALIEALDKIAAIQECHSVAGGLSLLLKVRVSTTADLLDLTERLRAIPGVESTETTIVLKRHFDRPVTVAETHHKGSR